MEKILLISDHFYPETFLGNELPEYFRDHGFEVEVLTQNPAYPEGVLYPGQSNPWFRITRMNGIKIHRLKTITGYRDSVIKKLSNYLWFMFAATIFILIKASSYKYLFVYHVGTLTEAVPLYIGKKLFHKRTSIWTQDIWPDSVFAFGFKKTGISFRLLNHFVSSIYSSIDCIMVSSPGFVDKIRGNTLRKKKPIFIPQWAPKELFSTDFYDYKYDNAANNFVFTGNVGTQQNLNRVVDAFGTCQKQGIRCALHIFGDGRNLEELKLLSKIKSYTNIVFHGRIKQSQILDVIKRSDACILSLSPDPTMELTLPAKFQTYIYSEQPILCIAGGEAKSLVNKYAIGIIADPSSVDSIVEAIKKICSYSDYEKKTISMNQRKVQNLFNEDQSKKAILEGILGYVPETLLQ